MLTKLKNPGTLLAIASALLFVFTSWGLVDIIKSELIMTTIQALCTVGILLGVLNDPNTPGIDPLTKK